jgi:hypothetical protein
MGNGSGFPGMPPLWFEVNGVLCPTFPLRACVTQRRDQVARRVMRKMGGLKVMKFL